jgi:Rrf2 family protein
MIKPNRTTEYGLMALRHMSRKNSQEPGCLTSAREIADLYSLPFEITAKTLQRLKDTGIIESAQGARGGYTLHRALSDVTLAEFLQMMEGPQNVVGCATTMGEVPSHANGCEYSGKCEIKSVMSNLNAKVLNFLSGIRLAELAESEPRLNVGDEP